MGMLKRLDLGVYRVERWIVVASLAVMSAAVFLDVTHRTFASSDSRIAAIVARSAGLQTDARMDPLYQQVAGASNYIVLALAAVVAWFAVGAVQHTQASMSTARRAALAAAVALGLGVFVAAVITLFPNGFVWAQPLALVLTLWVGLLGASMCTHEGKHLRVEAVVRKLPAALKPKVEAVSSLVTAAFCVFIMVVSLEYVMEARVEWVASDYRGGMVQGADIPKWLALSVLPLSFAIMAVRFVGQSVRAWRGEEVYVDAIADMTRGAHSGADVPVAGAAEVSA